MYTIESKTIANKIITLCLLCFLGAGHTFAQKKVIDQVAAVVGNKIILQSDLQEQYDQYIKQGYDVNDQTRCIILENLLYQKLLLNKAAIDSVTVTDSQVETELNRRIRYFVEQIGSEKKLEDF